MRSYCKEVVDLKQQLDTITLRFCEELKGDD